MKTDDPNLKPQYRMPRVFGALPGPRNVPKDKQHWLNRQTSRVISVTARTDAAALAELLPPDSELDGDPRITLNITYLKNIGWLAGRGYNIVSVTFPIAHHSPKQGRLTGNFFAVVWENLADPILTGREELGWSKIYAEIPEPVDIADSFTGAAGWMGFRFLEIEVADLKAVEPKPAPPPGQFHYKFIPRTGSLDQADVAYLEYSPPGALATGYGGGMRTVQRREGRGRFRFHHARWEDVPFQYPIINALADLPVQEVLAASVTDSAAEGPIGDVSTGGGLRPLED